MDVLASVLTIIAAIISRFTGWMIDGYIELALSGFIIYTSIDLLRDTINTEEKIVRFDVVVDFASKNFNKTKEDIQTKLRRNYPYYSFDINIDLDYA